MKQLLLLEGDGAASAFRSLRGSNMKTFGNSTLASVSASSAEGLNAAASAISVKETQAKAAAGALRFKKLLVPVELSKPSIKTLRFAVRLAQQFDGTISVIHVVEPITSSHVRDVPLILSEQECALSATKRLNRWCHHTMAPGLCERIFVSIGKPIQEITQAARRLSADLIIMSTHGYTGLEHLLLRSVTEQVVRNAPCPTLAIHESLLMHAGFADRGPASVTWKNILVPIDFTPSSRQALRCAVAIAAQTQAKLTLLHKKNFAAEVKSQAAGRCHNVIDLRHPRNEMGRVVEYQLDAWAEQEIPSGIAFEKFVYIDAPAANIIAHSAQCMGADLIVMGNHHYSWWKHLGRADFVERVIRTAPCPVLSVPESASERPTTEEDRNEEES